MPLVDEELNQILAEEDELVEEDQELVDIDVAEIEQGNTGEAVNQENGDDIEPRNKDNENQEDTSDPTHDQGQNLNDVQSDEALDDTTVTDEVIPLLRRSTQEV